MLDLWLFFPLVITLHNLEEAVWLPRWSRRAGKLYRPVESDEFYFAALFVTILAYVVTFMAVEFPSSRILNGVFHGFLGAMILNTFVPHLTLTILLRKYSPGLLTGLFLMVPVNSMILYQSIAAGVISRSDLLIFTLVVSMALLSLLPLLFKIGRYLTAMLK